MELTYASYLKLEELLRLQEPQSDPPEHDEMLFIVIHQVYELWFKLLLHELDRGKAQLSNNALFEVISTFKRVRMVLKTLVGQLDILETMTPMSFVAFRARLDQASGFQSMQFRELEFLLGHKRAEVLEHYKPDLTGIQGAKRRLEEPSIMDHFYDLLEHRGVDVPARLREKDVSAPTEPDEELQTAILVLYKRSPDVALLLELMTDIDEGLQEWRYRHVKMVERTIGNKKGTGGSLGVEFLRKTLFQPIFPDLWAIRHQL